MHYIELSRILINGEELKFSSALIIIEESNGLKSWMVECSDAEDTLMDLFISGVGNVSLTMIGKDGKEYKGEAFVTDDSTFRGTGILHGFK